MLSAAFWSAMSDRSDELTERRNRDVPATDDLLEETDRLRSESGVAGVDESVASAGDSSSVAGGETSSWYSPLTARLSLGRYFSPKGYAALVALLGVGLLVGATVLPIAGRMIGMFVTAFLIGLVASKRRYLEVTAAGISVGAITAVLNNAIITVAGSGQTVVAIGATFGLFASLVGYYFGRDLHDGLNRDLE
ncbi:hypothetical protein SAMN05192552_101314 [Natrinema hispanicum]|uniref:DUF456 domain-containing protein n=2 Tax=Natrinema hispanicum TaxID=392421 RepID=A0A1G6S3T9_9EURY|nr:hypothetical protein SAMN05192552_101314 [Natrinema hispanicum]SET88639.1 hypothetical protein SAMN04488694_11579 [Natrinema hispanicum]